MVFMLIFIIHNLRKLVKEVDKHRFLFLMPPYYILEANFMNIEIIMSLVTIVVTLILGLLAKKATWISDHIIPIQNLFIGIVVSIIYYLDIKVNFYVLRRCLRAPGTFTR